MKSQKVYVDKVKMFNDRLVRLAKSESNNRRAKFIPGASLFLEGKKDVLRIVLIAKAEKIKD